MKNGDKYKNTKTGKTYSVVYATPRSVALTDESGTQITTCRRDFDENFQEVNARGRKATGKK